MKKHKIVLVALLLPLSALAFDPYTYLNYLESLKITANSVTALQNQLTQIQHQLEAIQLQTKNTTGITQYQWNDITRLVQQIDQVSQQGQSISYAMNDVEQQFKSQYPNYLSLSGQPPDYMTATQNWHATTLNTLQQSLQALNLNATHFAEEQNLLQNLKSQGETAQGRMQMLQVLSQMTAENMNQLQSLKRALMNEANAENAYMAYQVSQSAYEARALQEISAQVKTDFPPYSEDTRFGLIPYF